MRIFLVSADNFTLGPGIRVKTVPRCVFTTLTFSIGCCCCSDREIDSLFRSVGACVYICAVRLLQPDRHEIALVYAIAPRDFVNNRGAARALLRQLPENSRNRSLPGAPLFFALLFFRFFQSNTLLHVLKFIGLCTRNLILSIGACKRKRFYVCYLRIHMKNVHS